jgi:hypothetical protein
VQSRDRSTHLASDTVFAQLDGEVRQRLLQQRHGLFLDAGLVELQHAAEQRELELAERQLGRRQRSKLVQPERKQLQPEQRQLEQRSSEQRRLELEERRLASSSSPAALHALQLLR